MALTPTKIVERFADAADNSIAAIIETTWSDGSKVYDVRIYADEQHVRDLACNDLDHAIKIFRSIQTCL